MPAKKKTDKKEEQVFVEEEGSYVHEEQSARYVGGVRRLTESTYRCRHGRGVFTSPLVRYDGDWQEDEMHGSGELRFLTTGDTYRGQFVRGMFEGSGTYTWASGAVYDGAWRSNRIHGLGTYTDVQGKVWSGKFYNGTGPGLTPFAGSGCKGAAAHALDEQPHEQQQQQQQRQEGVAA
ncbi:central apparatus associated protein C1a-18 [Trypanosoma grayi]|uniref:central apparatus associated protein C1a-18 n=1 Tax=Trypanosoma grayi TaxID=71804 RepID=UPI0004F404D5|nr:central apparatus associated protein C1a-18 [Trypanosoma grayi]KEG06680.1 central apparatus associated protein C1a-18 [Trypanosoma grayi]